MIRRTFKRGVFLVLPACAFLSSVSAATDEPLPSSFDLRNIDGHSYIGPVRDQGQIGSCYAFAAISVAEAVYNRATGHYDDNCADFSESFIVWSMDPYYDGIDGPDGADNYFDELQSLVDYGVCSEADFPYVQVKPADTHMDAPRVKFTSWHRLPSYDIETMKRAIEKFGAIDVGIVVDHGFNSYTEGVYSNDDMISSGVLDYDDPEANHAVALIGWDDSTNSWILRNSWGTGVWSEDGYMNLDYTSVDVTCSSTCLLYGEWTGEDFSDVIAADVTANPFAADGQTKTYGYYRWGGNDASVANNALIKSSVTSADTKAFSYGMFLYGGANATMTNNGQVISSAYGPDDEEAVAYGLCMQGGLLTNNSSVTVSTSSGESSYACGIRYIAFDTKGAFVNNGEVNVSAIGALSYATGAEVNDAASVVNNGTIHAEGKTQSVGLAAEGCTLVINKGLIEAETVRGEAYGAYILGGTFINEAGATVIATSRRTNTNGLIALNAAIVNNGTISGDLSSINTGSLAGAGSFEGSLNCTDVILLPGAELGKIGTLSVSENFTARGTLSMAIDVSGVHSDVLAVGGSADLSNVEAKLTVMPQGYVPGGEYVFITSTDASGSFEEVVTPAMFEGSVSTGAEGFTLDLSRNSYSGFSVNQATEGMALAMDNIRPKATGGLATVLDTIDTMVEDESVQAAVADLYPSMNVNASFAALSGLRRMNGYIEHHFKDGVDASDGRRFSTWFNVLNSRERRGVDDVLAAYDDNLHGVIAGVDRKSGSWTFGAAASNATQSLRAGDTGSSSIRTRRGYLYAFWDRNADAEGLYATANVGFGSSRIDVTRGIDFLGETARSRHGANNYSLSIGTGYDVGDPILKARPFANIEYDLSREKSYRETDPQGAALAFSGRRTDSLSGELGLSVSSHLNIENFTIAPEARIYRLHEFMGEAGGLEASFGEGAAFRVSGRGFSPNANVADFTLRVIWANRVIVGGGYARTEYEDGGSADAASAWVQIRL